MLFRSGEYHTYQLRIVQMRDRLLNKKCDFMPENRDMFHIQLSLMQNAENIRKDGNNDYVLIQNSNFKL